MPNDLPTMNSQPKLVSCNGKTYKVYPLTFEDMGNVQLWIDEQQEKRTMGAMERAIARGTLPVEIQKFMARSSMDLLARNRILLGTPEAETFMQSLEGMVYLTWYSIQKGDKAFTIEEAEQIVKSEMGALFQEQVKVAADIVGPDDPKSTAPGNGSQTPGAEPKLDTTGGASTTS